MTPAGLVVALFTAPVAGAPVVRQRAARALVGRGLDGDRYAVGAGSFSRWPGRGRAVTLVDAEAIRAAEAEFGVRLSDGEHRRNVVVEGVPLADGVGERYRIGGVLLEGVRVCAPCQYLVRVTGQAAVFDALIRRGGLRAEVIEGGRIAVGDAVVPEGVTHRRHLPG